MSTGDLLISFQPGVRKIIFNRPSKKNAINKQMYIRLAKILNDDAQNDEIVVTIITGMGEYYSSGNDIKTALEEGISMDTVENLVQAFINYPKILIAVLNGPALGIAATTAALCDVIFASDRAYFETPFIRLGLCAEGASSFTFPSILGRSKASELLFLNKRLSAQEACKLGLVSEVIPHEEIYSFIESLHKYGSLPVKLVKLSKELVMKEIKQKLLDCNSREVQTLKICVESEEFSHAILQYFSKKSKL